MIPLEDWMIVELYEKQRTKLEVSLELPDTIEKEQDEAAVFKVLKIGPEVTKSEVGDIVQIYGLGSITKVKLPNGKYVIVAKDANVCFKMEEEDLG